MIPYQCTCTGPTENATGSIAIYGYFDAFNSQLPGNGKSRGEKRYNVGPSQHKTSTMNSQVKPNRDAMTNA